MKQKMLFTCECCHTDYADKKEAEACEANHKKKIKIIEKRYLSKKQDASGLPMYIVVQAEDGTARRYKRG